MHRFPICVPWAVCFLLAACSSSDGGGRCTTTRECTGGLICIDNRCVEAGGGDADGGRDADGDGDADVADVAAECSAPCIDDRHCVGGTCISWADGETNRSCEIPPEPFTVAPRALCHWPPVGVAMDEGPAEWQWARRVSSTVIAASFVPSPGEFQLAPTWLIFATGSVLGSLGEAAPAESQHPGGVLRVLDVQTCRLVDTLDEAPVASWFQPPAVGDLDGDGIPEIVAQAWDERVPGELDYQSSGPLVAWKYHPETTPPRFRVWRRSTVAGAPEADLVYAAGYQQMSGPTIADLDDDGRPEVLLAGRVYDNELRRLTVEAPPTTPLMMSRAPAAGPYIIQQDVVADLDADSRAELVYGNAIFTWNPAANRWDPAPFFAPPVALGVGHAVLADFGEFPDSTGAGRPEVVVVGYDGVRIQSIAGVVLRRFDLPTGDRGGSAPSVADVDGDTTPEILVGVDQGLFVYDLECDTDTPGPQCLQDAGSAAGLPPLPRGVRWADRPPAEAWDFMGATTFDFDGDGRLEVMYADECFLRVYDGPTGRVIYSHWRPSRTASEVPIVVGTNGGADTVIAIGLHTARFCSQATGAGGVPPYDPQFPGLSCLDDRECWGPSGSCRGGRCRCTTNAECCAPGEDCAAIGYACHPAPDGDTDGNTCRAIRVLDASAYAFYGALEEGIDVLTDGFGRWAASRTLWNQDAYAVTGILDDGTIPPTSAVLPNWSTPGLNNFRSNVAGAVHAAAVSDPTARGVRFGCTGGVIDALLAEVCNRGSRVATSGQTVRFTGGGTDWCDAHTSAPLAPGTCVEVRCAPSSPPPAGTSITAEANPDGRTRECGDPASNVSEAGLAACP
jgi:hypothetical protein